MSRERDRVIATILAYKDEFIDPHLPKDVAKQFRLVILDGINSLQEPVMNQYYLDLITEIHRSVATDPNEHGVPRVDPR